MVSRHWVRHQFLYVPEAPGPFWEETYLLGTTVSMDLGLPDMSALLVLTLEVSLEEEWCIHNPTDNKTCRSSTIPRSPHEAVLRHLGPGRVNWAGNRTSPNIGRCQTRS
jgi:hypothetical protein